MIPQLLFQDRQIVVQDIVSDDDVCAVQCGGHRLWTGASVVTAVGGPVPVFGDLLGGCVVFYVEGYDTHLVSIAGQLVLLYLFAANVDPNGSRVIRLMGRGGRIRNEREIKW